MRELIRRAVAGCPLPVALLACLTAPTASRASCSKFARAQVLFAKLNIVHASLRSFGNFVQKEPAAGILAAGKL